VIFNLQAFQAAFPEFAASEYGLTLPGYWNTANSFVTNQTWFAVNATDLALMLNLMTAHLAKLCKIGAAGGIAAPVNGGGQGSENVTLEPPPVKDRFTWWLYTTDYGKQLAALLAVKAAGGFYVGGSGGRAGLSTPRIW
jgi:hypothetical protein